MQKIKKHFLIGLSGLMLLVFLASLGLNVKTEIAKYKDKVFQQGRQVGIQELNQQVAQQFLQTGRLQLVLPDNEGKPQTIILIPQ